MKQLKSYSPNIHPLSAYHVQRRKNEAMAISDSSPLIKEWCKDLSFRRNKKFINHLRWHVIAKNYSDTECLYCFIDAFEKKGGEVILLGPENPFNIHNLEAA